MTATPNQLGRLIEASATLHDILIQYQEPMRAQQLSTPTPRGILIFLIYKEFHELSSIVHMLSTTLETLITASIGFTVGGNHTNNGRPVVDWEEYATRVTVHIKTTYEWLYHIQVLLKHRPEELKAILKPESWDKLRAYTGAFRNKLVAHRDGAGAYLDTSLRWGYDDTQLAVFGVSMPWAAEKEMNRLFSRLAKYFPPQEAAEWRTPEQCAVINRNLAAISGKADREAAIEFIRKYGTTAASPAELAEFACTLVRELFAQLMVTIP